MEFPTLKRLQEVVMKQVSILALILVLVTFVAPLGVFAETASAAPALLDVRYAECPIMGGKALTDVAIIHENKIYHFCCPSCIDTFKKDPAAAIAKIKGAKEVVLTVTNPDGKCPVCGKASNPEFFLVRGDTITYYFCKDCIGKDSPKADPASAAPAAAAPAVVSPDASPAPAAAPAADAAGDSSECGDCSSCGGCPAAGN